MSPGCISGQSLCEYSVETYLGRKVDRISGNALWLIYWLNTLFIIVEMEKQAGQGSLSFDKYIEWIYSHMSDWQNKRWDRGQTKARILCN